MRPRQTLPVAALVIAVWLVGLWVPAFDVVLLYLAPAALLALVLLSGRYPGERVLERLACRDARKARRVVSTSRPRALALPAVAGGVLLAAGLAGRAPPATSR